MAICNRYRLTVHYMSPVKYIFVTLTGYLYTLQIQCTLQVNHQVHICVAEGLFVNLRITCTLYVT